MLLKGVKGDEGIGRGMSNVLVNLFLLGGLFSRESNKFYDESCKVDGGLCLTHGFSVSDRVPCPVALHKKWTLAARTLE